MGNWCRKQSEEKGIEAIPQQRVDDRVISLEPYWEIKDGKMEEFKQIWKESTENTRKN
jgi:hypothetical protein